MTRLQMLSGLAALIIGLLVGAAILHFSSDSSDDETTLSPSDQTQVAVADLKPRDLSQEPQEDESPAEVVEEAPVEEEKADDAPSLERWMFVMRAQMEEDGLLAEEIEKRLERRRAAMEAMDPSEWAAFIDNLGVYVWRWNPRFSDRQNTIDQKLYELYGTLKRPEETPQEIIDVLVEGLDNLTAAQYLIWPPPEVEWGWKPEPEYAEIYLEKALQEDPTSRGALILQNLLYTRTDKEKSHEAARRLIDLYPDDDEAMRYATSSLYRAYPEEAIVTLMRIAPADTPHWSHHFLSGAYERLDMFEEAWYHNKLADIGEYSGIHFTPERRRYPSIWEERAAAAAAELAETPQPEPPAPEGAAPPPPEPHDGPPPPTPPDEPPHAPADSERDLADAYAQFAEAYRSAFEAEYGPPADTPEGRMNALLGIARAFAKAGDAEQAQAAYNEARKRYTRGQVQEAFRRLDEAERLRRQQGEEQEGEQE